MKKIIAFILVGLSGFVFINNLLFAQTYSSNIALGEYTTTDESGDRFVLTMLKGRSTQNTSIPAVILDSFGGIVWVCEDLENSKPIWIKTDLGQNKDPLSHKKYIARILDWQEGNFKVPAIVIDTEEGKAWTCPDVSDDGETWIQTDFQNTAQKELRGTQLKY